MTLEHCALMHNQNRRGEIADYSCGGPNFEALIRENISTDFPGDDYRSRFNLGSDDSAFANHEAFLCGDLPVDVSVDASSSLEHQLATDSRSAVEVSASFRVAPRF